MSLIESAINDEINRYSVNIAANDHMFRQNRNDKIAIMLLMMNCLFDNVSLLKAYFTLKKEYDPIKMPNIIPINRYSCKNPNVKKCIGFMKVILINYLYIFFQFHDLQLLLKTLFFQKYNNVYILKITDVIFV